MDQDLPPDDRVRAHSRGTCRTIMDDGVRWCVYELTDADLSVYDRRRSRSLVFESDHAIRRVRDFPDNWLDLPDEALWALSWGR